MYITSALEMEHLTGPQTLLRLLITAELSLLEHKNVCSEKGFFIDFNESRVLNVLVHISS